jgi:hypothetical protein
VLVVRGFVDQAGAQVGAERRQTGQRERADHPQHAGPRDVCATPVQVLPVDLPGAVQQDARAPEQ